MTWSAPIRVPEPRLPRWASTGSKHRLKAEIRDRLVAAGGADALQIHNPRSDGRGAIKLVAGLTSSSPDDALAEPELDVHPS
jgi:hypothetical protein